MYKLSIKEKKIIYELDMDSRQSISEIARKTRLSKEVVNYNMQKLEKAGIIEGYSIDINTAKLGKHVFRTYLRFKSLNEAQEKDLLESIAQIKGISWTTRIEGTWDAMLSIWADDLAEFRIAYYQLLKECEDKISQLAVAQVVPTYQMPYNFLYEGKEQKRIKYEQAIIKNEIDDTDRIILRELAKNARIPLTELAKKINSNANTSKYRIKRMVDSGIITLFSVDVNAAELGYYFFGILVEYENYSVKEIRRMIEYLSMKKNVEYIAESFGTSNLFFRVYFQSSTEVNHFLKEVRAEFTQLIKKYDLFLITSTKGSREF